MGGFWSGAGLDSIELVTIKDLQGSLSEKRLNGTNGCGLQNRVTPKWLLLENENISTRGP